MSSTTMDAPTSVTWEQDIRALEERGRLAFLAADVATLGELWADELLVNSPLNMINDKARVLDLLRSGRIRHTTDVVEIEQVHRYGDTAVVMGRDTVDGPPHGQLVSRRFTNVWQLQEGRWIMIARHAQIVPER
jgi:ketosteroid isomerase-like protein